MSNKKKVSTIQIGDGKLPNKYWVSVSEDYLYEESPGSWSLASDRGGPDANPEGKTLAVFPTYAEARELFDSIPIGELTQGVLVRSKTIEDRITGEVAEETSREVVRLEAFGTEDLSFTKAVMGEAGVDFV